MVFLGSNVGDGSVVQLKLDEQDRPSVQLLVLYFDGIICMGQDKFFQQVKIPVRNVNRETLEIPPEFDHFPVGVENDFFDLVQHTPAPRRCSPYSRQAPASPCAR